MKYPCHKNEIGKLNRVSGQIEGIKRMIDEGRVCTDILAQLRAARAALRSVEANVLEKHMHSCVADAMMSGNEKLTHQKIDEIKTLFKRFDEL